MRVVHVETGRHLYGGARQVAWLAKGLAGHGVENFLVCPPGSEIATETANGPVRVIEIPMHGDLDVGLVRRLMKTFAETKPDLVHLHSRRGADSFGLLAVKLARVPVVLTRRVDNPEPGWLARFRYSLPDRVITISEAIRDVLIAEGVPQADVVCIHSAVDTDRFRPRSVEKGDGKHIGVIAQFIERKGHDTLFDALPAVFAKHLEVTVSLYGRGPLERQIKQRIIRDGLSERVRLHAFRNDVETVLPEFDFVVHPARREGLGVALLEAASSGVPIVASNVGGIPEIVRDGVNGLLVSPNDPAELTNAINAMLEDNKRRMDMGNAGRELVLNEFTIARMVDRNLAIYKNLLAQPTD